MQPGNPPDREPPDREPPDRPEQPDPVGGPVAGETVRYGSGPDTPPGNLFGLLGMISGIAGIVLSCCALLGLLLGAAGVVLGMIGMNRVANGEATNRRMAIAGVVCGAVAILLAIVFAVLLLATDFRFGW